jgi:arginase family enzyme
VKTCVIFFPFDLFGSPGSAAGAQLLADEFAEMLADNRRERIATRARAYMGKLRSQEFTFETFADYENWRTQGRQAAREAFDQSEFLLWIAGNHLGVLPVYDELAQDSAGTLIVQLDAHLDIHHFSDCTQELSHGNFLRHCAGPLPRLLNVGHRELLLRPEHVREFYGATYPAEVLAVDPEPALLAVRKAAQEAGKVFLDIDCDALDPAFFPAASQSSPFGLSPWMLLRILDAAWSPRLAGIALSEFEPGRDQNDRSLAMLMWLIEYVLIRRHETARPSHGR